MRPGTLAGTLALAAGLTLATAGTATAQTGPDVTVAPTGTFDTQSGNADITGTFSCGPHSGPAFLEVVLLQEVGRVSTITGHAFAEIPPCSPGTTETWTALVLPDGGQYRGGTATAHVRLVIDDGGYDETAADVRLRGGSG